MAQSQVKKADTKQRILSAAGRLFREHGIDGVGVDAVMKEAGLTHGGFYLHFASKEALAAEVAGCLLEKSAQRWDDLGQSADRDAALRQIVSRYLDPDRVASGRCCPLTTLGTDVARRAPSRQALVAPLNKMLDSLARVIPSRRRRRAVTALSTMVGAVVLARLTDDTRLAQEFLNAAAEQILGPVVNPARKKSTEPVKDPI